MPKKNATTLLSRWTLTAMFLAMGLVLPFFTGPDIGTMLLPMHFPVLLCGMLCGWGYGALIGFLLPPLRFLLFAMPPLFPKGFPMAFELMVYGAIVGLIYARVKKKLVGAFLSLIPAMILGRIVWGIVMIFVSGVTKTAFTYQLFIAGALTNAIPGIALQLVIIPAIVMICERTNSKSDEQLVSMRRLVEHHFALYPQMEATDLLKLIYQNEFGCGHLISDREKSFRMVKEELVSLADRSMDDPAVVPIGNGLCRIDLRVLQRGDLKPETYYRFFELSALFVRGSKEQFAKKIAMLERLCRHANYPIPAMQLRSAYNGWQEQGSALFRHSETYRQAYHPAYRVVEKQFGDFYPLFRLIDERAGSHTPLVVAIDGRCGSGKTTLAGLLKLVYDCPVISMDSFFLQENQRTKQRLAQPGGNIDAERFTQEVLVPMRDKVAFTYRPYDCQKASFAEAIPVPIHSLYVIEGSYSLHPDFVSAYGLRVFITVSKEEQRRRIQQRDPNKLEAYESKWIVLEETYFDSLHIAQSADITFDTSNAKDL